MKDTAAMPHGIFLYTTWATESIPREDSAPAATVLESHRLSSMRGFIHIIYLTHQSFDFCPDDECLGLLLIRPRAMIDQLSSVGSPLSIRYSIVCFLTVFVHIVVIADLGGIISRHAALKCSIYLS